MNIHTHVNQKRLNEREMRAKHRAFRPWEENDMAAYAIFVREHLRDPKVLEVYNAKAGPGLAGHPVKASALRPLAQPFIAFVATEK